MSSLAVFLFFLFGTIIGSFLNVVIYRLHTNRSLSGRSHCMSCGHALSWYELLPVVSYLAQYGRCRACRSRVTSRYLQVELLTGALFALVASATAHIPTLALLLLTAALLAVIIVYDILHTIIPDELVIGLSALALLLFFFGEQGPTLDLFLNQGLAAVLGSAFFGSLWLMSRGRWVGLGDAKLAVPLGFMVGFPGVFSFVVLAFWVGAGVSIMLLAFRRLMQGSFLRGKLGLVFSSSPLTMKSEVPFAPFLIVGFLLVYLFGVDVFSLIEAIVPLP